MANLIPSIDVSGMYGTIGTILAVIIAILAIIMLFYWQRNRKRYGEYIVEIWNFKEDQLVDVSHDIAGVFYDASVKAKLFYMKKQGVGLKPDHIPYVWDGQKKKVIVIRTGLRNFHFLEPTLGLNKVTLTVGEEDLNWAEVAYKRSIDMLGAEDKWKTWIPVIMFAIAALFILMLFMQVFKNLPLMKDILDMQVKLVAEMAKANLGTTVVGG